jgi:Legume lectin domain
MVVNVLTQHNDNIRSGANLNETTLKQSDVDVNQFGLLCSRQVNGQIYAQPLYVHGVNVGGTPRNVVYVATMENWVYAFDADDVTDSAAPLWKKQVHPHPVPAHIYGAHYNDIVGNIGILSTPVIDAGTNTIYLVAASFDPAVLGGPVAGAQGAFQQLLFALHLSTGDLRPPTAASSNPVAIVGDVPGNGYHDAKVSAKPVDKTGGNANVTVPIVVSQDANNHPITQNLIVTDASGGQVHFSPMQHMNRPALLLDAGLLYIAFGSHGDFDPYHGWVFLYEASTLLKRGVFCATPNGAQGGIWQAGEGLVADGNGNIYSGTGNGDTKNNPGGAPDLGETFLRLRTGPTSLNLDAFLTAFQDATNPVADEDLGAASPTLLPDGFLVGGGKDGNFYLVDPSKMNNTGNSAALAQRFLATRGPGSRARVVVNGAEISTHHIHGSPVVYDSPNHGILVYVWGENEVLRAYHYDPVAHNFPGQPNARNVEGTSLAHGTLFASNDDPQRRGMPGAMLSISADGQTPGSAIIWACLPPFGNANTAIVDGMVAAYDATNFDAQGRLVLLWHSHQNSADDVGTFAKFCCPTIADGKVFVATFSNLLRVYGPRTAPNGGYNFTFGGTTGLMLNGSARSNSGSVRLTGQHVFQAGSCFCSKPVKVTSFTTSFRFRVSGANTADGTTFCVQGEGPRALGGPGSGLGYGPDSVDPLDPGFRITKSVALKFDLFDNVTNAPTSSMGLYQGGVSPTAGNAIGGEISLSAGGIDLHSGHEFEVALQYDGVTLKAVITDLVVKTMLQHSLPFDIPGVTGSPAFVGFTGATGGFSANQDILSWQFAS